MIRAVACGLSAIFLAGALQAEPVVVRSGDHGTFTRLTVGLRTGARWEIDQIGNVARLTLDTPSITFDVSEVFSRIGRNRLKQIEQAAEGAPLMLELNCECLVTAFEEGNTLLVLDIRPGRPVVVEKVELPIVFGLLQQPDIEIPPKIKRARAPRKEAAAPVVAVEGAAIQSQVDRAIAQGLLAPTADHRAQSGLDQLQALKRVLDNRTANVRATTVIDRDLDGVLDGISAQLRQTRCVKDGRLDIGKWGDDSTYASLGEMTLQIYGEFDRLDHAAVRQLAKSQLYLGFGAEAAATLGLDPTSADQVPELASIAMVIDERPHSARPVFAGQQACEGLVAFWALLADQELADDADVEAILNGFFSLPEHLRGHLGPRAAGSLVEAGKTDMAQIMMRRATPSPVDVAARMVQAKLSEAAGNAGQEMTQLKEVISDRSDPPEAPIALIELVETAWENRLGVDEENVMLAAAFAQEFIGSDLGPRLWQAHILALALSGNFDEAFGHPEMRHATDTAEVTELRQKSLTLLVENAADIAFLVNATDQSTAHIQTLDTKLRIAVARRLQQLGFSEQAMKYLELPKSAGSPMAASLLRAQSALDAGLPRRALLELSNADGEEAQRLRAEALAMSNELVPAAALYQELGEADAAARSLWLSEEWAAIPEGASPVYREAGQLSIGLSQEPAVPDTPTLGAAQAVAETARDARTRIEDLLAVIERP
ncbi:hypothetical protein Q5Y75_22660 [Ruegeria sp. 2205SS24-7]|uniref:hypothetical protein n=1 Tax=Ruegeria discodermiae TaxID=3064389 RepID=UPI0027403B06|nr:hypothetical protein [Ruegeria sp. 2205SS24-7]MDP5220016.1 hypothetical protein [Ruegeria sp. 2205SS24-7]